MYGFKSKGEIPSVGTPVSVKVEDPKIQRVIEVEASSEFMKGPTYTPPPTRAGVVRWPKACMSCGEAEFSKLKGPKIATWNLVIDTRSPKWKEFLKEMGKGFVAAGIQSHHLFPEP
jgi:hypothetical protein